jgi:hypothetical protein
MTFPYACNTLCVHPLYYSVLLTLSPLIVFNGFHYCVFIYVYEVLWSYSLPLHPLFSPSPSLWYPKHSPFYIFRIFSILIKHVIVFMGSSPWETFILMYMLVILLKSPVFCSFISSHLINCTQLSVILWNEYPSGTRTPHSQLEFKFKIFPAVFSIAF